jgi:hypothetical protein
MVLHETLKRAKIAEDLFVYFLEQGVTHVNIDIDIQSDRTVFTTTIQGSCDSLIQEIRENLYCKRDVSVEEYGWEVMVEEDSEFELDHIGYLIDSCDVSATSDGYRITLHRLHD